MKHLLKLFFILIISGNIYAQNIFSVNYENQADLNVSLANKRLDYKMYSNPSDVLLSLYLRSIKYGVE